MLLLDFFSLLIMIALTNRVAVALFFSIASIS